MPSIKITKIEKSRISQVDLNDIPFGQVFTDHYFIADYNGQEWINCEIKPLSNLSMHPGTLSLHYGQAIFEGMKAFKQVDGKPVLFRPEMHAKRINISAKRMCMPDVPEDLFIDALHKLVDLEQAWIPESLGSSLYIRPFMIAMDTGIGVKPSITYKFMILTLPVGPYYDHPVRLKAEEKFVRAVPGGAGFAKAAGNYAAALLPDVIAKSEGYDQVMWLDGHNLKDVQEVGTMNIFVVIGDTVITPELNGAILAGITRDSILQILKDEGYKVEERNLSIDEIVEASEKGLLREIFGAGTAAVITFVNHLSYQGKAMDLNIEAFKVAPFLKDYINSIRLGTQKDQREWVIPVEVTHSVYSEF